MDGMFNPLDYPEALVLPRYLTEVTSWQGHIPFAMVLVALARPKTLVELGVFKGDSYSAFCQAVDAMKLETKCFGVDTWQGDQHSGPLPEQMYQALKGNNEAAYGRFSKLMRMTFDEALRSFESGSVDILHIDGLHTYEAVKHDFETWLPKMSERGVVLFHDTAVRHGDFGVWKLWEELTAKYEGFDFQHSNGLGVLLVGSDVPPALRGFVSDAKTSPEVVRAYFRLLGEGVVNQRHAGLGRICLETLGRRMDAWRQVVNRPGPLVFGQIPPQQVIDHPHLVTQKMIETIDELTKA